MLVLFKFLLNINLLLRAFKPGRHCASDSITAEADGLNEFLGLPRVGLILEPVLSPSDDSVEDATFLAVVFSWADSAAFP